MLDGTTEIDKKYLSTIKKKICTYCVQRGFWGILKPLLSLAGCMFLFCLTVFYAAELNITGTFHHYNKSINVGLIIKFVFALVTFPIFNHFAVGKTWSQKSAIIIDLCLAGALITILCFVTNLSYL